MNEQSSKQPFHKQIDSIAYFLTGLFAIKLNIENGANPVLLVLGYILIATGFVILLSSIKQVTSTSSKIWELLKRINIIEYVQGKALFRWIKNLVLFLFFMFTYFQVFVGMIELMGQPYPETMQYVYYAFLLLLPITTFYSFIITSKPKELLSAVVSLCVLAIYITVSGSFDQTLFTWLNKNISSDHLGLIIIIIAVIVLTIATLSKINKERIGSNSTSENEA